MEYYRNSDAYNSRENVRPLACSLVYQLCAPVVPCNGETSGGLFRFEMCHVPNSDCFLYTGVLKDAQEVADQVGHVPG
jgi:hypothetical protein